MKLHESPRLCAVTVMADLTACVHIHVWKQGDVNLITRDNI